MKDPLVGKYFLQTCGDRTGWHGQVLARVDDNYLLQLWEWFLHQDSDQTLHPASGMLGWQFYDTVEGLAYGIEHRRDLREIATGAV